MDIYYLGFRADAICSQPEGAESPNLKSYTLSPKS